MNSSEQLIKHGAPSEEGLPHSSYVRIGDFNFLSSLIGFDEEYNLVPSGIVFETSKILATEKRILNSTGCGRSDVVKVDICLLNFDDFAAFNAVYARHFPLNAPARATIFGVILDGACVEIEMTAFKPLR